MLLSLIILTAFFEYKKKHRFWSVVLWYEQASKRTLKIFSCVANLWCVVIFFFCVRAKTNFRQAVSVVNNTKLYPKTPFIGPGRETERSNITITIRIIYIKFISQLQKQITLLLCLLFRIKPSCDPFVYKIENNLIGFVVQILI